MVNQHFLVRACPTCVKCGRMKDEGLLLCWPCHHAEKRRNDGAYSKQTERKIAALELKLKQSSRKQEITMPMHNIPTLNDVEAHWGIAYHSNSRSPRSKKWYRVTRLVHVDGKWFELYWHPDLNLRGKNHKEVRERALNWGLHLLHGVFCEAPAPRHGSVMQWSIEPTLNRKALALLTEITSCGK